MSDSVYHADIVALAKAATGAGTLAPADKTATIDNPLCGDRAAVDLSLSEDRVIALAHRVRGCLLCQASASLLAQAAIGRNQTGLVGLRDAVAAYLAGDDAPVGGFAVFAPVRQHPSRHTCVLLPLEAAVRAAGQRD
ncbi:MAG: iron-sulfur cluster assembly scaffold protein [Alphaproteobacteria bacterium]|nr:iron-sulfur cluster assembly scaffold protein [Alphaproteobacteria bacterium]